MRPIASIAAASMLALTACGEESRDDGPAETDSPSQANGKVPDPPAPSSPTPDEPDTRDDGKLGSDAVMEGEWFTKRMAGAPAALFGPPESEAAFTVRCAGRDLVFTRGVRIAEGGPVDMTLMAGGETRRIEATAKTDPLPSVTGRMEASDPFAQILGSTTQPIAIAVDNGPTFSMPSSAGMREVVSNCGK